MKLPLVALAAVLCVATNEARSAAGPVELFNGKDLSGWEYIATGQAAKIDEACKVGGGVISVVGTPGKSSGYIVAPGSHQNYRLHVEWRWTSTAVTASTNGGILLNISPGPLQQDLWPVSFQVQTKVSRAGDIIAMSTAASTEAAAGQTAMRRGDASEKTPGEWNVAEISVRGNTIACVINGVMQNSVSNCVPGSGRIGFQLEGHAFELRNIRLTPLSPEDSLKR